MTNYDGDYDYYLYKSGQSDTPEAVSGSLVDELFAKGGTSEGGAKGAKAPGSTRAAGGGKKAKDASAPAGAGKQAKSGEPAPAHGAPRPARRRRRSRNAARRRRAIAPTPALKGHRKRLEELDRQMERDRKRLDEVLATLADPDFYTSEASTSDVIAEHAQLKQRLAPPRRSGSCSPKSSRERMARQQELA